MSPPSPCWNKIENPKRLQMLKAQVWNKRKVRSFTSLQMVHAHINTYRHTNNSLTRKSFIYIYIYISFTFSYLFPAFPIPSSTLFDDLLEEVDMWGYPVLYLKKKTIYIYIILYYIIIYIYVHTNAVFAYIKKYKHSYRYGYVYVYNNNNKIIIIIYIYIRIYVYTYTHTWFEPQTTPAF